MRHDRRMGLERRRLIGLKIAADRRPEPLHDALDELGRQHRHREPLAARGMGCGNPHAGFRHIGRRLGNRRPKRRGAGRCGIGIHGWTQGSSDTPACRLATRASTKRRSPRRLRYSIALAGIVVAGCMASVTTRRSARRQTVRAT